MGRRQTIFTDATVILESLYREELARLADTATAWRQLIESKRSEVTQKWNEPLIDKWGHQAWHPKVIRETYGSLANHLAECGLDGPFEPPTVADIDCWMRYDLTAMVGRPLSGSERIRWQQQIRVMRADGLVETHPATRATEICLTDQGRGRAAKLLVPETASA